MLGLSSNVLCLLLMDKLYQIFVVFHFKIDTKEVTKIAAPNAPTPRYGHTAVSYKGRIYIFGGYDNAGIISIFPFIRYFLSSFNFSAIAPLLILTDTRHIL